MFGLTQQQAKPWSAIEVGRLRHKYGSGFPRVVSNRLNDRTLSPLERNRWRALAQQI